jgi:predicted amidohydrolase YtcJ
MAKMNPAQPEAAAVAIAEGRFLQFARLAET